MNTVDFDFWMFIAGLGIFFSYRCERIRGPGTPGASEPKIFLILANPLT